MWKGVVCAKMGNSTHRGVFGGRVQVLNAGGHLAVAVQGQAHRLHFQIASPPSRGPDIRVRSQLPGGRNGEEKGKQRHQSPGFPIRSGP